MGSLRIEGPALDDRAQRGGVEMVELVAALAAGAHEAGLLEDGEVLGDGLARGTQAVPVDQSRAEREQGLAVGVGELVEQGPPRRVGECAEHVAHEGDV